MKVLIVGAGIGGLTFAAFLKECGIDFDIIEQASDWKRHGYSLGIWSNGRSILSKLGLASIFDSQSEPIHEYLLYDGAGKLLAEYDLKDFYINYGSAYTQLNRDTLHGWLLAKVGQERVQMGVRISSLAQSVDSVDVAFNNASRQQYDLVVGADGVHSQIRKYVCSGRDIEKYTQWRAWFFWIDNKFKHAKSIAQYVAPGQFISIFDDRDKTLCVMVAPQRHEVRDEPKDRIRHLGETFKDHRGLIPAIFEGVKPEDIMPTDLETVHLKKWHAGRVVLLGDAAHTMEPFAGLGASMAMEDAYVLAGELASIASGVSLEKALIAYEGKRKTRIQEARAATQALRQVALTKSSLWNKCIDMLLPYLSARLFVGKFHRLLRQEI